MPRVSKFDENWIKNKDFLKNGQNWPLGGGPGDWGQKFYQTIFCHDKKPQLTKFGNDQIKNKEIRTLLKRRRRRKIAIS